MAPHATSICCTPTKRGRLSLSPLLLLEHQLDDLLQIGHQLVQGRPLAVRPGQPWHRPDIEPGGKGDISLFANGLRPERHRPPSCRMSQAMPSRVFRKCSHFRLLAWPRAIACWA